MKAMTNALHFVFLGCWALLGAVFTLHSLGSWGCLLTAGTFWLWLVGFAAFTSVLVAPFTSPLATVGVHVGTLVALALLPRIFPLSLMRVGLDVLLFA